MFNAFKDHKKHCRYFKYLSVISTIIASLLIALATFTLYKKRYTEGITMIVYAIFYMISYFQNRLLYTICKN